MVGASLKHAGVEVLRRIDDLDERARRRELAGLPMLHPWANRLAAPRFRAAGKTAILDPTAPVLMQDRNGLLNHGVAWPCLAWQLLSRGPDRLRARLDWDRAELLAVFPFRHVLVLEAALDDAGLAVTATLEAHEATPVSFGFHPYLGVSGPRSRWRLRMPAMRRIVLDERSLPTGIEQPCAAFDAELGSSAIDQGFAAPDSTASIELSGAGVAIAVDLLEGFRYVQIYAPPLEEPFVCIEPMTAPANALLCGRGLTVLSAGEQYRAAFRIRVRRD